MEVQFVKNMVHPFRATKKRWFSKPSPLRTKLHAPFNSGKNLISHKDTILDLEHLYMRMDDVQYSSNAINTMVNIDEVACQRKKKW